MVTSLLSSSSPWNPPPPMYPHPQRKKGNSKDMLRLYFAIISVFVFLPVLYLHSRLMGGDDGRHHHRPIHKKLGEFKSKRSQRDFLFAAARKQLQEQSSSTKKLKNNEDNSARPKFLTAYLEPVYDNDGSTIPFSIRNTTASLLTKVEFPNVCCADDEGMLQNFPIDNYPTADPFLPWIHDYFPNLNNTHIQFVAQNRRRCDTGEGMEKVMKFWEPQIALFQPIGVVVVNENSYRLATSFDEATHNATRFQCRFHSSDRSSQTTFSIYPFDYEYVHWRKKKSSKPMYQDEDGAQDMGNFWLSSLLFSCPIPTEFQNLKQYYLDLIPIRTPARKRLWFSPQHTGPSTFPSVPLFDAKKHFGTQHFLPDTKSAGRWANLPICRRATMAKPKASIQEIHRNKKPYRLVACTWTSASYTRRGDAVRVGDSARRLEEWIHFHLLVGFEHIYVYDNSDIDFNSTTLKEVAQQFGPERVTYHPWPCKVCNNNRPAHKNPGERSSQYAAEASCRERYGPLTEWMTFLDTDEYLVPMKKNEDDTSYTWHTILDEMDQLQVSVMKFLSSRSKPRIDLMETLKDQSICVDPWEVKGPNANKTEPCIGPMRGKTFLNVYNCDYIRPPKPDRFARAMKQIYRTSFVLSHFVHYSTVTADLAQTFEENKRNKSDSTVALPSSKSSNMKELFMDELTQGVLIHARSVLTHEMRRRSSECYYGSRIGCMVGYLCDDTVIFVDELHKNNSFRNTGGEYCNCWRNPVVENVLVPLLEHRIQESNYMTTV